MSPDIEHVRIRNSENNTDYYLYVRKDRLDEFIRFVMANRTPERKVNPMPGLSWAAICGLDAIFDRRPKKFPTDDIIKWLQVTVTIIWQYPDPLITNDEIEYALERFSEVRPPDVSEDA